MRWVLRLLVAFFVTVSVLAPSAANAQPKGCQDQYCNWGGKCYQCSYGPGFACTPVLSTCPTSCTESRCGEGLTTEACLRDVLEDPFGIQLATVRAQPASGTALLMHPQQGPVALTEVTFGTTNLFSRGFAINLEGRRVETVRLGRARVYANGKHDLFVTDSIVVENVVGGQSGIGIGEQPAFGAAWDVSPKMTKIVFFVAEAKFEGGRLWKADLDRILSDLGTGALAR